MCFCFIVFVCLLPTINKHLLTYLLTYSLVYYVTSGYHILRRYVEFIIQLKRQEHITSHRKDLYWLSIPARTGFEILTITWKALNDQAPDNIKHLIKKQQPIRQLRRSNRVLLAIPNRNNTNKMADRAFSQSVPKLWNGLPDKMKNCKSLESFEKNLKTNLFTKYYNLHSS